MVLRQAKIYKLKRNLKAYEHITSAQRGFSHLLLPGFIFIALIGIMGSYLLVRSYALTTPSNCISVQGTNPVSCGVSNFAVHVKGNHLANVQGRTIRFIGINRVATYCTKSPAEGGDTIFGPTDTSSVMEYIKWHINAVRISTNEDCWLGINNSPGPYSGANYRDAIVNYVNLLTSHHIYAILDLHNSAPGSTLSNHQQVMADASNALTYWKSVANSFKGNRSVVFEPYNEPYITTKNAQTKNPWACWLHGCTITQLTTQQGVTMKTNWRSAGMQEIVDTIRATGAHNIIALSGLSYAHNLVGILHYIPQDRQHQLAVVFHNYAQNSGPSGCGLKCWNAVIQPISKMMPVLTDELGQPSCKTNYVTEYMNWADRHGISYLMWGWDTTGCASKNGLGMLQSWNGTPNQYGRVVFNHYVNLK